MGRKSIALATTSLTFILTLITIIAGNASAAGESSASLNLAAYVKTTTAITVEINSQATNTVAVNVIPASGVAFKESDEATITIASNNRTGVQANMIVDSPNLVNSDDNSYYISSLAESANGYTPNNFPANTWGIAVKENGTYSNYYGLSTGITPMFSNSTAATTTQAFKIGTKVDTSLIPGEYSTSVRIAVVPNPSLYMQDVMYWKDSVAIGESIQVIDNRDMKTYWVTRIETDPSIPDGRADCTGTGNDRVCSQLWMTQNLDLELSTEDEEYTHYNTDLGWTTGDKDVVWTPQSDTVQNAGQFYWGDFERSYNFGEVYYYPSATGTTAALWNCVDAGYSESECKHYHAGNIYNHYTAVAKNATSNGNPISETETEYSIAPNSICPAGWKLPVGMTAANGYTDYDYVLYQNGIIANHAAYRQDAGYAEETGFDDVRSEPFWLVTAGAIDQNHQHYWLPTGGLYWTSTMSTSPTAYRLFFQVDGIYPSLDGQRGLGHTIRCIAR